MRLTNELRDKIVRKAMRDSVAKGVEALKIKEARLAKKLWEKVYAKAEREAVMALPAGWVRMDKCLRFNLNGMSIILCAETALPVKHSTGCMRLGDIACEKLGAEFLAFHEEKKALSEKEGAVKMKMKTLLHSVHTLKQLEQVWPEGKKIYGEFFAEQEKPALPATLNSELNDLLGIKTNGGK